jgi:hypothetical protein
VRLVAIAVNCNLSSALAAMTDKPSHHFPLPLIGSVWREDRQAPLTYRRSNNGFPVVKKFLQEV